MSACTPFDLSLLLSEFPVLSLVLVSVLVNLFFILTVPRLMCLVFSLASPVSLVGFCSPGSPRCFHTALIPPVYKLCVCPVSVPSVLCCTLFLPCQSVLSRLSLCLSYSVIVSALVFLAFIPTLIKAVILSLCLPAKSCIIGWACLTCLHVRKRVFLLFFFFFFVPDYRHFFPVLKLSIFKWMFMFRSFPLL